MEDTSGNTTQDGIDKLQSLKGKTKLKFQETINANHDEIKYHRQVGDFKVLVLKLIEVLVGFSMKYC